MHTRSMTSHQWEIGAGLLFGASLLAQIVGLLLVVQQVRRLAPVRRGDTGLLIDGGNAAGTSDPAPPGLMHIGDYLETLSPSSGGVWLLLAGIAMGAAGNFFALLA